MPIDACCVACLCGVHDAHTWTRFRCCHTLHYHSCSVPFARQALFARAQRMSAIEARIDTCQTDMCGGDYGLCVPGLRSASSSGEEGDGGDQHQRLFEMDDPAADESAAAEVAVTPASECSRFQRSLLRLALSLLDEVFVRLFRRHVHYANSSVVHDVMSRTASWWWWAACNQSTSAHWSQQSDCRVQAAARNGSCVVVHTYMNSIILW
jgi:hypothetical protein